MAEVESEFKIVKSKHVTVTVIKEGYAYLDEEGWMRANASCTLVQSPDCVVIVDTLTPWDGPFILQRLADLKITPDAITHVISTHGHSDHNGNNNLFLKAKHHICGYCVSHKDVYNTHLFDQDEAFIVDPFLQVIPTPGHTNEDVSLTVNLCDNPEDTSDMLIIAGDLFENEKDILNPYLWTGNSFNPKLQVNNRLKVLKLGKTIIPGHGAMFKVEEEYVKVTEELVKKYDNI